MYSNSRVNLYKRIAESQNDIRKKYKKFKKDVQSIEENVNQVFKPIIEPLNTLASNSYLEDTKENSNDQFQIFNSTPKRYKINKTEWEYKTAINDEEINEQIDSFKENKDLNLRNEQNSSKNIDDILDVQEKIIKAPSVSQDINKKIVINEFKIADANKSVTTKNKSLNKSINKLLTLVKNHDSNIDTSLGVRKLKNGYRFGDKSFDYDENFFKIGKSHHKITTGLTELLFKKNPDEKLVTDQDKTTYQQLIIDTNAHKKNYKADSSIRKDNSRKCRTYLLDIVMGKGLFKIAKKNEKIEYKYWNDPNELVERLILLDAEKKAGNNNHDNEIENILQELQEQGFN